MSNVNAEPVDTTRFAAAPVNPGPGVAPAHGFCSNQPTGGPFVPGDPATVAVGTRAMADTEKLWPNGTALQVFFLNGTDAWSETVRQAVRSIAPTWGRFANLTFDFVTQPVAHITINLLPIPGIAGIGTYNCWHGTDCVAFGIKQGRPSMNLVFDPNLQNNPAFAQQEFQRVILHEFGHALGLIHEHIRPDRPIVWNEPLLIQTFQRSQGWSEDMIRAQIINFYTPDGGVTKLKGTAFDLNSIMMYSFQRGLAAFDDGQPFETPNNIALTALDKVLISMVYPKTGVTDPEEAPLVAGDPPVAGTIADVGQVVRYRFRPQAAGMHVIETRGSTPLLVALLRQRKDPAGRMLAFEATSTSFRFLPKAAGQDYFIEVRHGEPMSGKGGFEIGVRAAS